MKIVNFRKGITGSRVAMASAILLAPLVVFGIQNGAQGAVAPVPLGTTASFSVLAASTVTNTGTSVINGNVGLSPGTSVTGFPPGVINGTQHITDAVAAQAQVDLTTAYNNAASQGPTNPIVADLGGQTLTPGVYNSASSIGLTGALTLNAGGDPNAVFVFQANTSTLTTASASQVVLINGAQACNVFWQVGSSATLGTGSLFQGTVLASASVTVTTGVTINGRVLAKNGAVTLDTDTITTSTCATPTSSSVTTTPTATTNASANTTTASNATTAAQKRALAKAAQAKARAKAAADKIADTTTPAAVPVAPKSPVGTIIVRVTG
jgi:hypothetical protein